MKTLSEIRTTKSAEEDALLARPGITGIDIGPKVVKGAKTGELAIRVFVEKKGDVEEKDRIPPLINGIKTDVIERRFVLHQRAVRIMDLERKADQGRYDPLVGGISIGPCKAVGGYVYTGTLGCMVKDRDSGELLMLSNYHVMAEKWAVGDALCQPSRVDTGSCPADTVGTLVRSVISTHVDGAVAKITQRSQECTITEIGAVKGKAAAAVGMAVRKRGRTTGLTYGTVESIDASVKVPYDDGDHILKNQITIEVDTAQSAQFGNSGDSGSVVVEQNGKVIGLYFAGTDDGSFGVANPIDYVLDELNIDLCIAKSALVEKLPVTEKWRLEKFHWADKNLFKEVAYDKPPFAEYKQFFEHKQFAEGPTWEPPVFTPPSPFAGQMLPAASTGAARASLEERLVRLEALLLGPRPSALVCADFSTVPPVAGPNPVTLSGATFTVFDFSGAPVAGTRIVQWGGLSGLDAGFQTQIRFAPCSRVELTLAHFAAGATAMAYDAAGNQLSVASTTPTQAVDQSLILTGANIVRVDVKCPQNEVILRRFCHCGPKKLEKLEKPEWKEKLEPKEFKEKPEPKELKEKPEPKELKEKPEPKELKEKPEPKELKELEPKQIKELEPKQIIEGGNPFQPGVPFARTTYGTGSAAGPLSIEERLARLEAALGGYQHFIGADLRPDLSGGALKYESDQSRRS